jgi:nicotinate-nucleotide adenylyltransferase
VRLDERPVAFFGGTFDPPHMGHLEAVEMASAALDPEPFLVIVANIPWQKVEEHPVTPAEIRLEMARRAFARFGSRIEVSDLEIKRGGPSYTVETARQLRAAYPDRTLYMVVGSELVPRLHTWQGFDELPSLMRLAVVLRKEEDLESQEARKVLSAFGSSVVIASAQRPPSTPLPSALGIEFRPVPIAPRHLGLSSSSVRDMIGKDSDVRGLVPASVLEIVRTHGLYQGRRSAR